jgi:Domain of unknown function (DUF4412)
MTKHLIASCTASLLFMFSQGQVKTVDKAIVKMKTEMQFPENFGGGGPSGEGGERIVIAGGGPGGIETSMTAYYRGDFTKIESVSDFGNNMVIIDHKQKKTTTLIEAMGRKTGFYSTEEDDAAMRARMDSARNARRDSLQKAGLPIGEPRKPVIEYIDETKKIAGYTCKKAIVKTRDQRGETNATTVWYCPDFKIAQSMPSGGGGGMMGRGMMMMGMNGLDQLEGYPMEIQMERSNGMKVHTVVTSVKLDAGIEDKVFEIPKGYDLKPLKDMQGGDGRVMFRMGGGGN